MSSFCQCFFRQISLTQDSPKFNNAKVSSFTVPTAKLYSAAVFTATSIPAMLYLQI